MTKVLLTAGAEAPFRGLTEPVEVCDHEGRTLGVFTPAADRSLYEGLTIPFSEEEIRQAEEETESYSTEEVLAHLESLQQSP